MTLYLTDATTIKEIIKVKEVGLLNLNLSTWATANAILGFHLMIISRSLKMASADSFVGSWRSDGFKCRYIR